MVQMTLATAMGSKPHGILGGMAHAGPLIAVSTVKGVTSPLPRLAAQ